MLLEKKHILITGVLTDGSLAYSIADLAQRQGAEIALTSFGRAMSLTTRAARRLPEPPPIFELDVANESHFEALCDNLAASWPRVDGIVHAIGYAPEACLGDDFLRARWEDVAVALQVSAYSLKSLTEALLPLMDQGGSVVGLDFVARQAWPQYGWMGVAKAALESSARYLARTLGPQGIRVNLVCAGPVRTVAAKSIPGFEAFEGAWAQRAPLGWDVQDRRPVAQACAALLSDWFPATTGEMVHVDGGFHAVGA